MCINNFIFFIFNYVRKFKVGKHQNFSLIDLFLCICIIYKNIQISLTNFLFGHFLIICFLAFITFTDHIERYLVDTNYINPFYIIMSEGISTLIMFSIYSLFLQDPFKSTTIYIYFLIIELENFLY